MNPTSCKLKQRDEDSCWVECHLLPAPETASLSSLSSFFLPEPTTTWKAGWVGLPNGEEAVGCKCLDAPSDSSARRQLLHQTSWPANRNTLFLWPPSCHWLHFYPSKKTPMFVSMVNRVNRGCKAGRMTHAYTWLIDKKRKIDGFLFSSQPSGIWHFQPDQSPLPHNKDSQSPLQTLQRAEICTPRGIFNSATRFKSFSRPQSYSNGSKGGWNEADWVILVQILTEWGHTAVGVWGCLTEGGCRGGGVLSCGAC